MLPGAQHAGHYVNYGGAGGTPSPPFVPLDWTPIPATDFSADPASHNEITMTADYTGVLWPQQPIRIHHQLGYSSFNKADQWENITGLTNANLDSRGMIYVETVSDGGWFYHIDIYKRPLTSPRTAAHLIGHTGSYDVVGVKAVAEDNGSGLGGTVRLLVLGAGTGDVQFWRWHVINTLTDTLMSLYGPVFPTIAAGDILDVWYGHTTRLVTKEYTIDGRSEVLNGVHQWVPYTFCDANSWALLYEDMNTRRTWEKTYARVCRVRAIFKSGVIGDTPPVVWFYDSYSSGVFPPSGLSLLLAGTWYSTDHELGSSQAAITRGDPLEVCTLASLNSPTPPMSLTMEVLFVLE